MQRSSKVASAEDQLKALRKLEGNKTCPNCGTVSDFGFGSVCIKYKTFVCDLCKTSHQAISHRVKSVTMSTWTMEEVRELNDSEGGGNDAARHVWLANAPPCGSRYAGGVRPKAGEKIEIFKQFVVDCYEHGKFRSSEPYQGKPNQTTPTPTPTSKPVVVAAVSNTTTTQSQIPVVAVPVVVVKSTQAVSVDLLNDEIFSSPSSQQHNLFDPFAISTSTTTTTTTPPQQQQQQVPTANSKVDDLWSSFLSATSPPQPPTQPQQQLAATTASNDPFAGNNLFGLQAPLQQFTQSLPSTPHGSFHPSQQQQQQQVMQQTPQQAQSQQQEHVKRSVSAPSLSSPQWTNTPNAANAISNLMIGNVYPQQPQSPMMMMYPTQRYYPQQQQPPPQPQGYPPTSMYNDYNTGFQQQQQQQQSSLYGAPFSPQYNSYPTASHFNNININNGGFRNAGNGQFTSYNNNNNNNNNGSAKEQDPAFGFVQNMLNK